MIEIQAWFALALAAWWMTSKASGGDCWLFVILGWLFLALGVGALALNATAALRTFGTLVGW